MNIRGKKQRVYLLKHVQSVELGKEYNYITMCNDNSSYTTVGKATFSNYRTYTSDDIHPEKDGHEWKSVDFSIVYTDENAWEYGMRVGMYVVDYYDDTRWTDDGLVFTLMNEKIGEWTYAAELKDTNPLFSVLNSAGFVNLTDKLSCKMKSLEL